MAMQRTKAQWAEIIEDYEKSGQTMASWCRENGVNAKTMGNHVNAGKIKRKVRTLYEWSVLLEKQKSSGMSISGWCRENGVKEKAMRAAAAKIAKLQNLETEISERKPSMPKRFAPASWVEVEISEASPAVLQGEIPNNTESVFSIDALSAQASGAGDKYITSPAKVMPDIEKGANMRIRIKNLEIEVNNGYPAEKLTILMKGLIDLC